MFVTFCCSSGGGDGKARVFGSEAAIRGGGVADLVRKFVLNSHFLSLCSWLARFHTHWSVRTLRAAERVSLTPHSPLISPPWFQPSWSYDPPPTSISKYPNLGWYMEQKALQRHKYLLDEWAWDGTFEWCRKWDDEGQKNRAHVWMH